MMYDLHNAPVSELSRAATIEWLAPLRDTRVDPGALLDRVALCAKDFREEFRAAGIPDLVETCDLITLPYPTRFGLWRASMSPAPFVSITNRMLVVHTVIRAQ
jgi:hypothetical protein